MSFRNSQPSAALALATLLLLGACRAPEITTYPAPKDPAPPAAEMPAGHPPMPNMSTGAAAPTVNSKPETVNSGGEAALTWTAPAAWTPKPPGQMVTASYTVPAAPGASEAAATISSFPGDVGGTFANVNRWRGQIGLAPIAEKDLAANTTLIENASLRFTVVDITNPTTGARMLGAILPVPGETYFFKMTGPAATVAAQKQAFLDLLKTVQTK